MPRETILTILLIALIANLCLMTMALMRRRRRSGIRLAAAGPGAMLGGDWALESEPVDTVALTMTDPASMSGETAGGETAGGETASRETAPDATDPDDRDTAASAPPPPDAGSALVDAETGLPTSIAWDEAFRAEAARVARYHGQTTVVVAELDGLEALAGRLGQDVADGLIAPVADALRRNARAADRIARVGHARFNALLPETDEITAINYVERVRASCDKWLEAGALSVRLALGWASPASGSLEAALHLAEARMNVDRRRSGPDPAPNGDPWIRASVRAMPDEHPGERLVTDVASTGAAGDGAAGDDAAGDDAAGPGPSTVATEA